MIRPESDLHEKTLLIADFLIKPSYGKWVNLTAPPNPHRQLRVKFHQISLQIHPQVVRMKGSQFLGSLAIEDPRTMSVSIAPVMQGHRALKQTLEKLSFRIGRFHPDLLHHIMALVVPSLSEEVEIDADGEEFLLFFGKGGIQEGFIVF